MSEEQLASSYSERSKRHAILAQDSNTAWVYMHGPQTAPATPGPVDATCFAYNLCDLIATKDVKNYRPAPPPIAVGYGSDVAVCRKPMEHRWQLRWSEDGNVVVLLRDGDPWCLVSTDEPRGYSKAIQAEGPWGNPWSEAVYLATNWDG